MSRGSDILHLHSYLYLLASFAWSASLQASDLVERARRNYSFV